MKPLLECGPGLLVPGGPCFRQSISMSGRFSGSPGTSSADNLFCASRPRGAVFKNRRQGPATSPGGPVFPALFLQHDQTGIVDLFFFFPPCPRPGEIGRSGPARHIAVLVPPELEIKFLSSSSSVTRESF